MKLQTSTEPPLLFKKSLLQNAPKLVILTTLALVVFTALPIYRSTTSTTFFLHEDIASPSLPSPPSSPPTLPAIDTQKDGACDSSLAKDVSEDCDIFSGEWVSHPQGPHYTNSTCWTIQYHQNCMRNGRKDTDYLKWRWKPNGCELPVFDPAEFLKILKGKSLAFVGDSVARNQMQSLLCLLSQVAYPLDVSETKDENFKRWFYVDFNFTLEIFWSPFLVRTSQPSSRDKLHKGFFNLYLDEFDLSWTTKIQNFDYVIISAGHWFFRPTMFYENSHIVGCLYCTDKGVAFSRYYGYRKAFRTAFRAINRLHNFNGTVFLRSFAPSHFEHGLWNKGGICERTRPYKSNETKLEEEHLEFHAIQIEEFRAAKSDGMSRGFKFRLIDATNAMLLRPDGHPSVYGQMQRTKKTLYYDCVHWCLPGPIDAWNEMLLHMLKMEATKACRDEVENGGGELKER